MYSTCLFCNGDLGRNEAVEHLPVGRRLAFDAAKGRLWVVCRRCERWNLTPLEERWEAIEECERAYSQTKLRVSTEHVGLARLPEGLELVRIGEPQRPEMAAWRYGDQFGRRRRRQYMMGAGVLAVGAGVVVAGPMLGIIGAGAISPVAQLLSNGFNLYRARTVVKVPTPDGIARVRYSSLPSTQLLVEDGELLLRIREVPRRGRGERWMLKPSTEELDLKGDDAIRAAGALLPRLNANGGSQKDVSRAVGFLEEARDTHALFRTAVRTIEEREPRAWNIGGKPNLLKNLPAPARLALEMSVHEESERRALEGELHVLEEAWRQAEEIAGIADDMFLPAGVEDRVRRMHDTAANEPGDGSRR